MNSTKTRYSSLAMLVLMMACHKAEELQPIDFSPENPAGLSISVTNDSIEADSVAMSEVVFTAVDSIADVFKQVTFTISPIGKFANGSASYTTMLDGSNQAKAFVRSSNPGTSSITATLTNVGSKTASIYFNPSYPEGMILSPDTNTLVPSFSAHSLITAKLTRMQGMVSTGQTVTFTDSTTSGASIGAFFGTTLSNASGEATSTFYIQDTSYHGMLYIKGKVNTPSGVITGMNTILIQ